MMLSIKKQHFLKKRPNNYAFLKKKNKEKAPLNYMQYSNYVS